MNSNYRAGRAFEYEVMNEFRERGYSVARTAGSHGEYDVLAFRPDRPVELIQCKRVGDKATGERLLKSFSSSTMASKYFHQVMMVKIKGTKKPLSITV